jgi:hypothetical protein
MRLCLELLKVIVRKVLKICIFHSRIHMYFKAAGLAHEDPKKKNPHKWIRYERSIACPQDLSVWSDDTVCVIIGDAQGIKRGDEKMVKLVSLGSNLSDEREYCGKFLLEMIYPLSVVQTFGTGHLGT